MTDYINQFNIVSSLPYDNERTQKKHDILQNMINISNNIYNIGNLLKNTDDGTIVFCLTLIKTKLQNHKCAYNGPIITDKILNYILENTNNKSDYIQEYSRHIISLIVDSNILSDTQIQKIKNFVESYDVNSAEKSKKLNWVHNILVNIYKGMNKEDLLGCIIGKCVGDSLGFQVEGYGPDICKQYVNEIIRPINIPNITRIQGLTFGQYTDDSQLTRELLISIIDAKGIVDGDTYAKRMSKLFIPGNYRIVGYGKTCATALEAVWNGAHYTKTGCNVGHGNGSAMRSSPIGLLYGSCSIQDIVKITKMLSSITHSRERCMSGAAAIALAAKFAAACKNIKFDIERFIKFVANTGDIQLDTAIKMIPEFMSWEEQNIVDYIVRLGLADGESKWDGISAGVTQTVLWSLYSFCKYNSSYIDCISCAIAVGGDVDTTAAIAGSLCGIRVGYENIPEIWREKIHDITEWDYNDLCNLVENVVKIVPQDQYPEFRF